MTHKNGRALASVLIILLAAAIFYLVVQVQKSKKPRMIINAKVGWQGLPAPENNLVALQKNAPKLPIDLTGEWQGTVRLLISEKLIQRPIHLSIIRQDGNWVIKYTGLGDTDLPVSKFKYVPPILSYEVDSFMWNSEGDSMPFLAELVVFKSHMAGLYRQVAREVGTETLYIEYDANFNRSAN